MTSLQKHSLSSLTSIFLFSVSALAHTWTTTDGETLEAEFSSLKEDVVTLTLPRGTNLSFPVDTFIQEDQDLINQHATSTATTGNASALLQTLENKLVKIVDGQWQPTEIASNPEYLILYFSASWCGPCRARVPHSIEKYNDTIAQRDDVELIWVSADFEAEPMLDWAAAEKFPWPTLAFEHIEGHPLNEYAKNYVPYSVLVDQDGTVIVENMGDILTFLAENPAQETETETETETEAEAEAESTEEVLINE